MDQVDNRKLIVCKIMFCLLPIIVLVVFSFVVTTFFQTYFMTGWYLQKYQEDYAENDHSYNRVLVMGDSHAGSAYVPSILSQETYNFAMGGENPVDGYYRLVKYLENHESPEYLFVAFNEKAFCDQNEIWNTQIKQHVMPLDMAFSIMRDAENYGDSTNLKKKHYSLKLLMYHYGLNGDSVLFNLKGLLNNLLGKSCHNAYLNACELHAKTNGYGMGLDTVGIGIVEARPTGNDGVSFPVTDMADAYMRKIIELCEENGICLIYETIPFNQSTYEVTDPGYMESYHEYWNDIVSKYPDVIVNSEISFFEDKYFTDGHHLNRRGAEKFSKYIRDKYSFAFDAE